MCTLINHILIIVFTKQGFYGEIQYVSFLIHMKKLLLKLGLNPVEARIYETLVSHGVMSVSNIASKTGLYRPQVYKYLPTLMEKNLIVESRHGRRTVYSAESPRQLEKLADNIRTEVASNLPNLLALYSTSPTKPVVQYLEGESGIRRMYEDILATCKKGDVIYRFESPRNYINLRKFIPKEYYDRIRDRAEVERYIITNESTTSKKPGRLGRYMKAIPKKYGLFEYDLAQIIYGNKVAFVDYNGLNITIIESQNLVEFQRKIFKFMFEKL